MGSWKTHPLKTHPLPWELVCERDCSPSYQLFVFIGLKSCLFLLVLFPPPLDMMVQSLPTDRQYPLLLKPYHPVLYPENLDPTTLITFDREGFNVLFGVVWELTSPGTTLK